MILKQLLLGSMDNFSYIIGDEISHEGAIIDPSYNSEEILKSILQEKMKIKYLINTHEHQDHTSGNISLSKKTGAKIAAHEFASIEKDIILNDGDVLKLGETEIRVIHTPGHSPASICLFAEGRMFTGDTLFVGECGRVDLPGGSARDLYQSLFQRLLSFDDDVEVYPGHNYGAKKFSTIGFEKRNNYVLEPRTLEDFIIFMEQP
jgi:glyoxylase-like metal-dependent hydrolase (beta-lactamase superfamily II)